MTKTNGQIAIAFLKQCFDGNIDAAIQRMAPDATWWTLGDPQRIRVSGERNVERLERFLKNVHRGFPGGMQAEFSGVTTEGERVAIEVVSRATVPDGAVYQNRYHFLIEMQKGLVYRVREYLDTDAVHNFQSRAT